MSLNRFIKIVLITIFSVVCLVLVGNFFIGPARLNYSKPIINGYVYYDLGGDGKIIAYEGNEHEHPHSAIVDSRVDDYKIDGEKILVARTQRIAYVENHVTKSSLSKDCEHWVIDTKMHSAQKSTDTSDHLQCGYH